MPYRKKSDAPDQYWIDPVTEIRDAIDDPGSDTEIWYDRLTSYLSFEFVADLDAFCTELKDDDSGFFKYTLDSTDVLNNGQWKKSLSLMAREMVFWKFAEEY